MSYGTEEGFESWIAGQGLTLPADSPTVSVLLARGTTYIDAVYGSKFCGLPTDGIEQEDAWPRTGAIALGQEIPPTVVPNSVIRAAYRAAYLAGTGVNLSPTSSASGRVKRQKVDGAAEREFFDDGVVTVGSARYPVDAVVDGLLAPFLCVEQPATHPMLGLWSIGS